MAYADEYAATQDPLQYAKRKPEEVWQEYNPYGEGAEIWHVTKRMAEGKDPHASHNAIDLASSIHSGYLDDRSQWGKLPILADILDDDAHPLTQHVNLRHADDAIRQVKKWKDADNEAAISPEKRTARQKRIKTADALRALGRHQEASVVADPTLRAIRGPSGRFVEEKLPADWDEMTRGYGEAALWSSHHMHPEGPEGDYTDEEPLDRRHSIYDIEPATASEMADDVRHFRETLPEHLRDAIDQYPDYAGYDLWLTRNHHGVGFWARDERWGEHGDDLTSHVHRHFGDYNLYISDANPGDREEDVPGTIVGQGYRHYPQNDPPPHPNPDAPF